MIFMSPVLCMRRNKLFLETGHCKWQRNTTSKKVISAALKKENKTKQIFPSKNLVLRSFVCGI